MDPVVLAVISSSLTSSLGTEAWRQVRDNVVALVRSVHPEQAREVEAELDRTRVEVVEARSAGNSRREQELTMRWVGRLHRVFAGDDALDTASQHDLTLALLSSVHEYPRRHGEWVYRLPEGAPMPGDLAGVERAAESAAPNLQWVHASPERARLGYARTLPRDVSLSGRDQELTELLSAASAHRTGGAPVCLVHGMPGSGKTALAVHAAHRLADQFPHGQIFINLAAHSSDADGPLPVSLVLETLLKSAGVPRSDLPRSTDGRASMWRSWLSRRRVLLVLDDAAALQQVEPILPGDSGCLTIITSRLRLETPLLTRSIDVGSLDPDSAAGMFERLVRRSGQFDHSAARAVVLSCGHLPIAITAAASELLCHPTWAASDLLQELSGIVHSSGATRARFVPDVGAVFRSSYRQLAEREQEFLRQLSMHPGTDLEPHAAAALAEVSVELAREYLNSLYLRSLLSEVQPGRFRMHELVQAFAGRQLRSASDGAALVRTLSRLARFYHDATTAAYEALGSGDNGATLPDASPELLKAGQAAGWLRQEAENIAAVARADVGETSTLLTELLTAGLLQGGGQGLNLARELLSRSAAHSAVKGQHQAEAVFRYQLGLVALEAGEAQTANDQMSRALALHQTQGTKTGEARALYGLGLAQHVAGHTQEAASHLARAADLFHELGTDLDEANSLYESGAVHAASGQVREAVQLLERAQTVYRSATTSSSKDAPAARGLPRDWAEQLRKLTVQLSTGADSASRPGGHDSPTWVTLLGMVVHHPAAIAAARDAVGGTGDGGNESGGRGGGGPLGPGGTHDPFDEDDEPTDAGMSSPDRRATEDSAEPTRPPQPLSPQEREAVAGQHVNFWFSDPDTDDADTLQVGREYRGCFQVGPDDPRNRVAGERLIPAEDIPPSGLTTRWIVYSTTAALEVPADADFAAEVSTSLAGDQPQWIVEFDLIVPTDGRSEERLITIAPQSAGEIRITADLFVGQDLYRQLTIDIIADEPMPPSGTASDPQPGSADETAVSHTVPRARPSADDNPATAPDADDPDSAVRGSSAASRARRGLRLQEKRLLPLGQTALRPFHAWQRPGRTLSLTLMPPRAKWTLEVDGQRNLSNWIDWAPGSETGEWVTRSQNALDAIRELCGARSNAIASQDVSDRLKRFQPSDAWSEQSQHFSEQDAAFWAGVSTHDATRNLAFAGHNLLRALFPRDSELHRRILELGPGNKLHVDWRSRDQQVFHVPWQLLYRGNPPGVGQAVNAEDFLGLRLRLSNLPYAQEHSRAMDPKATRAHLLYWGVGDDTAKTVHEHKQELVPWSPTFLPTAGGNQRAELSSFLCSPKPAPVPLIYIFCQGTDKADTPLRFGSTSTSENMLALADIGMEELEDHPLIFVNACDSSAVVHPFINTLQHNFMERGSSAYIGGECRVPTDFAARFASVFFHFLYTRSPGDSPTTAGEAMSQSRKFFWDEYRSIGGLFYSYVNDYDLCFGGPTEVEQMHRAPAVSRTLTT
ncbi:ATP-binding protein [Streptomyces sp. NPDC006530]|uniref:ATP-binding protein n=1 Tax=Streptomyces sp. NPDC006530 TaxID=3364750 RepID=UPI0036C8C9BB